LPGTTASQALSVSERIRQHLANLVFTTPVEPLGITASIGIAEYQKKDTLQTLIERADRSLYQAKETGRNRVVLSVTDHRDQD
jgi:diguanylate cyclase